MIYPEHEKIADVQNESQAVGEFLDSCGYTLCRWNEYEGRYRGAWVPVPGSIESILADHYGIDLDALGREKRAMLDALRAKP